MLSRLPYIEFILLNRLSHLVLCVTPLLVPLHPILLDVQAVYHCLLGEVVAFQDERVAAFVETARTHDHAVLRLFRAASYDSALSVVLLHYLLEAEGVLELEPHHSTDPLTKLA
jgi:hypothetical protein